MTAFSALEKESPEDVMVILGKGLAQIFLKAYQEAMQTLKKAASLAPNSHMPFYYIGILFVQMKKYEDAIKAFSKSIACDSEFSDAYSAMGGCLSELKRFPEAIDAHQKALLLFPSPIYRFFLGNAQKESGDLVAAKASYQACLKDVPDFQLALAALKEI